MQRRSTTYPLCSARRSARNLEPPAHRPPNKTTRGRRDGKGGGNQPTPAQRRGAHMRRGAEDRARAATTNDTQKMAARAELRRRGGSATRRGESRRRDRLIDMIKRAAYSSSSISHGYHCPAYMSATYSTHACSISSAVIVHPSGMQPWSGLPNVMQMQPMPRLPYAFAYTSRDAAHVAGENDWNFFAPAGANSARLFTGQTDQNEAASYARRLMFRFSYRPMLASRSAMPVDLMNVKIAPMS